MIYSPLLFPTELARISLNKIGYDASIRTALLIWCGAPTLLCLTSPVVGKNWKNNFQD